MPRENPVLLARPGNCISGRGPALGRDKLKAIIEKDRDGTVVAYLCSTEEYHGITYDRYSGGGALFEPSKRMSKRRGERKEDPAKIRAQVKVAAKEYVDQLIRQEALKNIS